MEDPSSIVIPSLFARRRWPTGWSSPRGTSPPRRRSRRLKSLNGLALIVNAQAADFDLASLLLADGRPDPATRLAEVKSWFGARDNPASGHHDHGDHESHAHEGPHDPQVRTFAVCAAAPIEWPALAAWLNSLVRRHGSKILRIKGLLNLIGAPGPVVCMVSSMLSIHLCSSRRGLTATRPRGSSS